MLRIYKNIRCKTTSRNFFLSMLEIIFTSTGSIREYGKFSYL